MDDPAHIERACVRLIHQFAAANDGARWEEVVSLFVEDGVFARPTTPDTPLVGRNAILKAFQSRPPRLTRHVVSNILVTVENACEARAQSLIQLYVEGEDGRARPPLVGEFHDRFVLIGADWRFRERRGLLVFRP